MWLCHSSKGGWEREASSSRCKIRNHHAQEGCSVDAGIGDKRLPLTLKCSGETTVLDSFSSCPVCTVHLPPCSLLPEADLEDVLYLMPHLPSGFQLGVDNREPWLENGGLRVRSGTLALLLSICGSL